MTVPTAPSFSSSHCQGANPWLRMARGFVCCNPERCRDADCLGPSSRPSGRRRDRGHKALSKLNDLESAIEPFNETYARFPQLVKALSALRTSIVHNRHFMPNDGKRYHNGEAIATGFVESTVNEVVSKRFGKKQQMPWSKEGAHWLLQTRVRTLNGELGAICKRWYPDMDIEAQEMPAAA